METAKRILVYFSLQQSKKIKGIHQQAKLLACCFFTALLSGCDMIDYHPYDTQVSGTHDINARNMALIESNCAGRDSIRFAQISDTQRWYDETADAVKSINARGDIDFVVHCGDLSDFGVTSEFEVQRDILEDLEMPYVVNIGNHDCLATGEDVFRYIFGDPDFSFNAGDTHFLCLNTNAFEYDYSSDVPDFAFIRSDCASVGEDIRRTVVAMHVQPYSDEFNNNIADLFQEEIKKFPGLAFCLCGHDHKRQINDIFGDGILYYECGAAKAREYIVYTLKKDGEYDYEVVAY